jgi:sigma-B regulation protein RsbU (phosphoserine phosphatase)
MAYLRILKGPNTGQRLLLERPTTILGRELVCDVVLDDPTIQGNRRHKDTVSRKHAVITCEQERFYIEDGDGKGRKSRNGTQVNDQPVPVTPRVPLRNGDVIKICDFWFLFRDGAPEPDLIPDSDSSIEGAVSHDSSSFFLTQPAEKLKLLLEITNRLSNTLELEVLLPQVVEALLQIFKQAERGFLILVEEGTGEFVLRSCKTQKPGEELPTNFSASIVRESLKRVSGLRSNKVMDDFSGSESVAGLALRSVMCAPLWSAEGRAFGVLQLDNRDTKRKFDQDDLNLLMAVASQASIALANARYHRDALTIRDLELARQVVKTFLPAQLPEIPGYEFFAFNESARAVGGDYYDLIPLPGNRLGILVGDVAGKGVAAALIMARFSGEARTCLLTNADLAAAVRRLNKLTEPLSIADRFVTLAALVLDPANHTLTVVNAGHPSPLLCRPGSSDLQDVVPNADAGLMLGVMPGYPYESRQVVLKPGDVVVVYTDGITDATNADGKRLGSAALRRMILKAGGLPAPALAQHILRTVEEFAAGAEQADDLTLVCLGRTA